MTRRRMAAPKARNVLVNGTMDRAANRCNLTPELGDKSLPPLPDWLRNLRRERYFH
jgi:hypothetical protein